MYTIIEGDSPAELVDKVRAELRRDARIRVWGPPFYGKFFADNDTEVPVWCQAMATVDAIPPRGARG